MSNEEVNFDYTLPEGMNEKYSESPAKNRKIKSNGKVNQDDLNQLSFNNEDYENQEENNENYEVEDYLKGSDGENNYQLCDEEAKEEYDQYQVDVNPNSDNFENKIKDNQHNVNNITNLSQNNKHQSKFLSTQSEVNSKKGQLSRMQQAEIAYEKVQASMYKIFEEDEKLTKFEANLEFDSLSDVYVQQNLRLIKNLEEISQILNIIIEASHFKNKKEIINVKENPKKKKKISTNHNNEGTGSENKLVEVFKTEYKNLKNRAEQINGLNYEENLSETSKETSQEIALLEAENRNLKQAQKQSEAKFERQGKHPKETNLDLKKTNADYMNMRKLNEQLIEKVQKNKIEIEENERKLNELTCKLEKNREIADNYGISEDYLNKKNENNNNSKGNNSTNNSTNNEIKQKENLKATLLKKCEVLEKVSLSNKKKYEAEISRCIKTIYHLESSIRQLYNEHNEKSKTAYMNNMKVSELYDLYNSTTSSTINSNNREYQKNHLSQLNENLHNNQRIMMNDTGGVPTSGMKENVMIDNRNTGFSGKSKPKIKPVSQQEQNRRKVKTEKIRNVEIKNRDSSVNPENDDTYAALSPRQNSKMNDKDRALQESVFKAKEFLKGIQKGSNSKASAIRDDVRPYLMEKIEIVEKNTIQNVDEEPISEMLKKYENLNKVSYKSSNEEKYEIIDKDEKVYEAKIEKNEKIFDEKPHKTKESEGNYEKKDKVTEEKQEMKAKVSEEKIEKNEKLSEEKIVKQENVSEEITVKKETNNENNQEKISGKIEDNKQNEKNKSQRIENPKLFSKAVDKKENLKKEHSKEKMTSGTNNEKEKILQQMSTESKNNVMSLYNEKILQSKKSEGHTQSKKSKINNEFDDLVI